MDITPKELRELLDEEYNRGRRDARASIKLPNILFNKNDELKFINKK